MEWIELTLSGKKRFWLIRKSQIIDVYINGEGKTTITQKYDGRTVTVQESYEQVKQKLIGNEVLKPTKNIEPLTPQQSGLDNNPLNEINKSVIQKWMEEQGYEYDA